MYCTHIYNIYMCIYIYGIYIYMSIYTQKTSDSQYLPSNKGISMSNSNIWVSLKKNRKHITEYDWPADFGALFLAMFKSLCRPLFFWLVNRIPYATPWHGDNPQLMLASIISQQIINHHWYVHQFSPIVWWLKRLKPLLHKWLLWH